MKLYVKQHIFTFGDKFSVYDRSENEKYYVEAEVFTFGKHFHIYDTAGRELATVDQEMFCFFPTYKLFCKGCEVAEIVKEFGFFTQNYTINGLGWEVSGDVFSHEYEARDGSFVVFSVSKEWFTWGDAYEIDIAPGADEVIALAVALVIDACTQDSRD